MLASLKACSRQKSTFNNYYKMYADAAFTLTNGAFYSVKLFY